MSTLNAIGYVRRSEKSDDTTVSLPEQAQQIERYCSAKGYQLLACVYHDGVSGGERSRFDDIHQIITGTGSDHLVFCYLDRFGRDAAGVLGTVEALHAKGITIHEASQGRINPDDPTQKLMLTVRSAMDENYRNVIKVKTRNALRYKREKGQRYTNVPPLGYCYREGKMVADAEEQRALTIISACRARGLGARRTKRVLIASGYTGRMSLSALHRHIKEKLPASLFALPE